MDIFSSRIIDLSAHQISFLYRVVIVTMATVLFASFPPGVWIVILGELSVSLAHYLSDTLLKNSSF